MVKKPYIPSRRDIVWINFNPALGHEQANLRPALVLSEKAYNQKTNLAVVCPITNQIKGYNFEVVIDELKITGAILSDHVRSIDWNKRSVRFIQKVSPAVFNEVEEKLSVLLFG